jgi:hypothetical protein
LVNVTADSVQGRLNLTENDVVDEKVARMIEENTHIDKNKYLVRDAVTTNADNSQRVILAEKLAR